MTAAGVPQRQEVIMCDCCRCSTVSRINHVWLLQVFHSVKNYVWGCRCSTALRMNYMWLLQVDKAIHEYIRCTALNRIVHGNHHWKLARSHVELGEAYLDLKGEWLYSVSAYRLHGTATASRVSGSDSVSAYWANEQSAMTVMSWWMVWLSG